jgi:hypothetical protein
VRRPPRWSIAALVAITVLGGALRVDAAGDPGAYHSRDAIAYSMIARGIVDNGTYGLLGGGGHGQQDPMHWPPGTPALFALAHAIDRDSVTDDGAITAAFPWQAAVGTLTIVATFALVVLVAGPAVALLAALLVALYPPLVAASGDLLSEPLGSLLLTAALAATVLTMRRPTRTAGAVAGLLLAATVLTRADLLLVPLIALVAIAAVTRSARAVAPVLVALVVVLTPWTIFASSVTGHLVPLSSGGASNLWVGTYLPGDGAIFGSKRALAPEVKRLYPRLGDHRPDQISQVHVIRTVAARHPGLSEEQALRRETLVNLREYAWGRPWPFAGMLASKVWRLWGSYTHGTYQRTRGPIRALHLALLAFGLTGLAAGLVATRRGELWAIAALLLYLTAMNAVLVSEARHNLTVMPVLIAGGAMGFRLAAGRLRRPRRLEVPEGDHVIVAAVHPARRPQTAPAVRPLPPG